MPALSAPLARLLDDAARGRFPEPDAVVEVYPQPPGLSAGVLGFTAHHIVAADVGPDWVRAHLDDTDVGAALKPPFLGALADLLRSPAGALDVVLVGTGQSGRPELDLVPVDPQLMDRLPPETEHARLTRARRYRTDIRAYAVAAIPQTLLVVGRGFAGRWEIAFDVPAGNRGRGLGRALAGAARYLVPPGEILWVQVSPGNAASLRAVLAAGFTPVGSEVLFATGTPTAPSR